MKKQFSGTGTTIITCVHTSDYTVTNAVTRINMLYNPRVYKYKFCSGHHDDLMEQVKLIDYFLSGEKEGYEELIFVVCEVENDGNEFNFQKHIADLQKEKKIQMIYVVSTEEHLKFAQENDLPALMKPISSKGIIELVKKLRATS